MLIEVKVKVSRTEDKKTRKLTETYVIDKEFFAEAEFEVSKELTAEKESHLLDDFEIVSMRQSSVKEICMDTFNDENNSFIATLRDTFHDDNGKEKQLKYNVLLWAEDLTDANRATAEMAKQGYDMLVEGIRQADYIYLQ